MPKLFKFIDVEVHRRETTRRSATLHPIERSSIRRSKLANGRFDQWNRESRRTASVTAPEEVESLGVWLHQRVTGPINVVRNAIPASRQPAKALGESSEVEL